jgi:hypothetical protein
MKRRLRYLPPKHNPSNQEQFRGKAVKMGKRWQGSMQGTQASEEEGRSLACPAPIGRQSWTAFCFKHLRRGSGTEWGMAGVKTLLPSLGGSKSEVREVFLSPCPAGNCDAH